LCTFTSNHEITSFTCNILLNLVCNDVTFSLLISYKESVRDRLSHSIYDIGHCRYFTNVRSIGRNLHFTLKVSAGCYHCIRLSTDTYTCRSIHDKVLADAESLQIADWLRSANTSPITTYIIDTVPKISKDRPIQYLTKIYADMLFLLQLF